MSIARFVFPVLAGLLLSVVSIPAHHSFRAEYDETQLVTLSGAVTKVSWKNPHVSLNLNVKDESGKTANWEVELASPNGLLRQGWKVDSLKPGDHVTVIGYAARDGSHIANARRIVVGGTAYSTTRDDLPPSKP